MIHYMSNAVSATCIVGITFDERHIGEMVCKWSLHCGRVIPGCEQLNMGVQRPALQSGHYRRIGGRDIYSEKYDD